MKGYKGFKAELVCDPTGDKPFQYTENTVFEQEDDAVICKLKDGEFVEVEEN